MLRHLNKFFVIFGSHLSLFYLKDVYIKIRGTTWQPAVCYIQALYAPSPAHKLGYWKAAPMEKVYKVPKSPF